MRSAICVVLLLAVGGCASHAPAIPVNYFLKAGSLPIANTTLNIPHLMSCTDNPDHAVHLKSRQPVIVLVHGCFGSSGQFRGLAQVLAFHGRQTVCFNYDDRDRLGHSAAQLRHAIDLLAAQTQAAQITVIGHSQGALIAHRALTMQSQPPLVWAADLRLVTISGPFGGIAAAKTCGRRWLYPATLGLLPLSCWAVTGAKWRDITDASQFIREPGTLVPQVTQFLKIDTDEGGSCRRHEGSVCAASDDIFSLAEQHSQAVEADPRVRRVEIRAGHVEIVGDERIAPVKLIKVLQEQGTIPATPVDRVAMLSRLMEQLYDSTR
jgi:pimeloyl-ACP methyl ester carboxylesterase